MTRRELENYKAEKRWVLYLIEELERINTSLTNISVKYSLTPKGKNHTSYKREELIDLKNNILEEKEALENKHIRLFEIINDINDIKYRVILRLYYLGGKSINELTTLLHYSRRSVKRMLDAAILEFDKACERDNA